MLKLRRTKGGEIVISIGDEQVTLLVSRSVDLFFSDNKKFQFYRKEKCDFINGKYVYNPTQK